MSTAVWQIYKDKTDKRSIRWVSLIDDLKQKFGLEDNYVPPGSARKDQNNRSNLNLSRTLSRKDFESPNKLEKDEIKAILRHLRVQAHDRDVNLEREFKE